jgi:hypothetical protein
MKNPRGKPQGQQLREPIRLIRNERGRYEVLPKPMSVLQLITAASKNLARELPRVTVSASLGQRRMIEKLVLFGELTADIDGGLEPPRRKSVDWNKSSAVRLIERANDGDSEADKVLRSALEVFLKRGLPLPPELGDYVLHALLRAENKKRKRGRPPTKGKFDLRDRLIAYTVKQVLRHSCVALPETRNVATDGHESACSIIAQALALAGGQRLSESRVNGIWRRFRRDYLPSTVTARSSKVNP